MTVRDEMNITHVGSLIYNDPICSIYTAQIAYIFWASLLATHSKFQIDLSKSKFFTALEISQPRIFWLPWKKVNFMC